jgi:hypothetical protein
MKAMERKPWQHLSAKVGTNFATLDITRNVEKEHAFAKHLSEGFRPHPSENELEEASIQLLETLYQLGPSINRLKKLKFKKSSTAVIGLQPHHW